MLAYLRPAILLTLVMTVLTGLVYPLVVTGVAQILFPRQANGSLIVKDGKVVGSSLIGQPFDDPRYFWSRPSATSPFPYNAAASSGSNLGPTNPALARRGEGARGGPAGGGSREHRSGPGRSRDGVGERPRSAHQPGRRPSTRSGGWPAPAGSAKRPCAALVERHIEGRQLGFLGEPRVNVLALNHALDAR